MAPGPLRDSLPPLPCESSLALVIALEPEAPALSADDSALLLQAETGNAAQRPKRKGKVSRIKIMKIFWCQTPTLAIPNRT